MPLNYTQAGAGDVASYQMSAVPYVTSSNGAEASTTPIRLRFPNATRFLVVRETAGQDLRIGFSAKGVAGEGASVSGSQPSAGVPDHRNYFVVKANETTPRLEIRCKELFFLRDSVDGEAGFTVVAGLTPITANNFPPLTGSQGYEGIG